MFEAARGAQTRFEAGVRLVDLTAVAEQGDVASAVATAVEAAPEQDATAAAVTAIGGRDPLLVIDNCEHVIDAVADCIDELLSSCPNLKVLATSREPLEVYGNQLVRPACSRTTCSGASAYVQLHIRVAATIPARTLPATEGASTVVGRARMI